MTTHSGERVDGMSDVATVTRYLHGAYREVPCTCEVRDGLTYAGRDCHGRLYDHADGALVVLPAHRVIGWYEVPEACDLRYQSYETAAWWTVVRVEAGRYPITAKVRNSETRDCLIALPGVVVADSFLPGGRSNVHVGEGFRYLLHPYAYDLAQSILAGDAGAYSLADDVQAVTVDFVDYRGESCRTWALRVTAC